MTDRLKKYSVSIIAVLLIVILIALPTGYEDAVIYQGTDKVKAKVFINRRKRGAKLGPHPVGGAVLRGGASGRKVQGRRNQGGKYAQRLSGIRQDF